jgi:hypothetical protein
MLQNTNTTNNDIKFINAKVTSICKSKTISGYQTSYLVAHANAMSTG